VNWEACGPAIKNMGLSHGLWMLKHISGMCGMNAMMKLWKKRSSDACPRCGKVEDAQHVWWCRQPEARLKRAQGIYKLSNWLEKEQTSPKIALAISSRLNTVLCLTHPVDFDFLFPGVQNALEDQDFIGWNIEGPFFQIKITPNQIQIKHSRSDAFLIIFFRFDSDLPIWIESADLY